jgi:hypothetical protein
MRKAHIILTIGGGFLGFVLTLQALLGAQDPKPIFYAIMAVFLVLYAYGIYTGMRIADGKSGTYHLIVFYGLQVPWISTPLIAYRFTSGFHVSVAFLEGKLTGTFRIGSDWHLSFLQPAPWGAGLNIFALVMLLLLFRRELNKPRERKPMPVTSPAEQETRPKPHDPTSKSRVTQPLSDCSPAREPQGPCTSFHIVTCA